MPRKPSSVFVFAETSAGTGAAVVPLQAARVPLQDGEEPLEAAKRGLPSQPADTTIYVVEDTKVTGYRSAVTLEEIDDPRLGQDDEGGAP
jgi:hypothetical protein